MFEELYAVAKHTPFTMIITPQGERLSVIIQPRPGGDAEDRKGLAAPIKAVGTPAELDAELPAKLVEYAQHVNDVRAKIDLPIDAVDAEQKKASKKADRSAARAAAKKKRADDQAAKVKARKDAKEQRKADAEKKKQEAADKRRARKAGKPGALPGATPRPPAPDAPDSTPREGLPGKPECLADYKKLKGVHGDKLTRRLFIKKAETGRRYEKLWKNWEAFVKEAEAQAELPLESVVVNKGTAVGKTELQPSAVSTDSPASILATTPPADPKPHKVYDLEGKLLHESKHPFVVGEKIKPAGSTYDWRIESVDGNRSIARMTLPGKQPVTDEYARTIGEVEGVYTPGELIVELENISNFQLLASVAGGYVARDMTAPRWVVFDLEGKEFSCLDAEPDVGDQVEIRTGADRRTVTTMRVVEVDGKDVTVAPIKPKQRAAEPAAATQE